MKHLENIVSATVLTIIFSCVLMFASASNGVGQTYRAPYDFDGDGKTDIAIYRPSNGQWWILRSSDGSNYVLTFGIATDKIVPADYTGDGKCDIAVYRPSSGEWFILRSEDYSYYSIPFGVSTDIPVPADYDGDGKADIAVWRSADSTWYLNKSLDGFEAATFGVSSDYPVPGDYDGDGKADLSVSRPAERWFRRSSNNSVYAVPFGSSHPPGSTILPGGDYTGDGKADPSVFSANENYLWKYFRSENGTIGGFSDVADLTKVPGDYNGDHRIDISLFNPATGLWTIYKSGGGIDYVTFGTNGDKPVPNAYVQIVSQ